MKTKYFYLMLFTYLGFMVSLHPLISAENRIQNGLAFHFGPDSGDESTGEAFHFGPDSGDEAEETGLNQPN